MTQPKPNDFPDPVSSTTEGGSEHVPNDSERSLSGESEKRNESNLSKSLVFLNSKALTKFALLMT